MVSGASSRSVSYFIEVYEAYCRAQALLEPFEAYLQIGDFNVCLQFAGSELASRMLPAVAHLQTTPTTNPDLTICFWDSISTGVGLPQSTLFSQRPQEPKEIRLYEDARIRLFYETEHDIFRLLDHETNQAIYWIKDAEQLPFSETTFAIKLFIHWWLADLPLQLVHAGAVGTASGGVLITGKGGSGKSTTTLACLNSDLLYLGDDYILVGLEPAPTAYSLFNTAKLLPDNLFRFPNLASVISSSDKLDRGKTLIYLYEHFPEFLIQQFPIRAVLLPQVTHRTGTRLVPASPIASLRALAPTTLFQMQGASHKAFEKMTQLVKTVPNYILEVGTDLTQIPEVIISLLKQGQP